MELNFNFIIIPLLVPFIVAGKAFLDHSDFKLAIEALVARKTIFIFLVTLFITFLVQVFLDSFSGIRLF